MARNNEDAALTLRVTDKKAFAILKSVNVANPTSAALEKFRKLMAEQPKKWAEFGDVMRMSCEKYINSLKATEIIKEPIKLRCEQLRAELSNENDGPLEKMLVEHVVLCWVRLGLIEQEYGDVVNNSMSLAIGIFWEKRINAVQKRYLRACETLARVRKLMRPPKSKLSVGTVNALLSGKYAEDTLSAVLRRKLDNPGT